jgi:hypothetical protein
LTGERLAARKLPGMEFPHKPPWWLMTPAGCAYWRGGSHCRAHGREERMASDQLNVRRIVMDVDKAFKMPSLIEISGAIHSCAGVAASTIVVTEIDQQTIGMDVTVEGEMIDYEQVVKAIEDSGAVVHSLDEISCGDRVIEPVKRTR